MKVIVHYLKLKIFSYKRRCIKNFKTMVKDNPHSIVAMAIFDMDIYKPKKMH